ncbi:ATP-binding cassette subfamily B protein [Allocatelliglobosispora scoriae]|uniref:ATP-binding cassette subfamily B protein n=1 Tax=Allocatelliglobosispora scoriae TaxID=643052 RepID=A0A841C639_9ACTN|nr:ABC transporter ATP-binding protein [Allocatelliglobosispora scoriae]MBB5874261.1 ATP-binding cassette subfamily B protein [Allocatelliglobosispora scoriae]
MTAEFTSAAQPNRRDLLRVGVLAAVLARRGAAATTASYALSTLVAAAVPVTTAWLTKVLIDLITTGGALGAVTAVAVGLAVAGLAAAAFPQINQYLRTQLDQRVALLAQDELYLAVERFSGLAYFENPAFLDRLRLAQQGAAAPAQVVDGTFGVTRGVLTLLGFLGSLAVISPVMALAVLATAVPTLLLEIQLSRRRAAMIWDLGPTERREFFYRNLLGSVDAAKEIRLFGIGGFLRGRMLTELREVFGAKRRMDRRELIVQGGLAALSAVVAGVGLVWAARQARAGALTIGDVALFLVAVPSVLGAMQQLIVSVAHTHQQLTMFHHYAVVVGAAPDLPLRAEPVALPVLRRGIELRDVWFRYSDEHPWVLRGVSMFIPHGSTVGLVGLNGAGKSTLVKLVCRFYDPDRGSITWDGVDLRDVEITELRARIGAVFQDYMSYDLTAADNIGLGDIASIDDRPALVAAAQRAGVHPAVEALPRGYDTMLSRMFFGESDQGDPETGVRFSGGQWQRLALARAFLRDKRDLMILDEPSAGLDAQAEYEVHQRLREHRAGRTSLLISHRLGSLRDADLIVVLADGTVAEQGDHVTLMAGGGAYAELFQLQAAGYQLSEQAAGQAD